MNFQDMSRAAAAQATTKQQDSRLKMTREKETFKFEAFINVEGEDRKCYVKCSVNYERLTYKVTPVITLVHDWNDEVAEEFNNLIAAGVNECKSRLAVYREEAGIGTQGDLFGEPSES